MQQFQSLFEIRNQFRQELKLLYSLPEIDSIFKMIVQSCMNLSPSGMMTQLDKTIDPVITEKMLEYLNRLTKNEPVQYVIGVCEFYGMPFKVNPSVLIPRQESEELVRWIVEENRNLKGKILDIGSGSGCLSISLKNLLPEISAEGWDKSIPALEIARKNAELNFTEVNFKSIDIFNIDKKETGQFDLIVSNPPYVRISEKALMQKNVLDFEPEMALFISDRDPLLFYRRIVELSSEILKPGSPIYFEINEAFGTEMIQLMIHFDFNEIELRKDLNGKDRMIRGRKKD